MNYEITMPSNPFEASQAEHEKRIDQIIKEFSSLEVVQIGKNLWQNKFHEFDVYEHTMDLVRHLREILGPDADPDLIAAGVLHDIGKPVVATPKIKDGKPQERGPGQQYHEFETHESVGAEMVNQMDCALFHKYNLNQERIAQIVGAHYIPMKGIKAMRKAENKHDFQQAYQNLLQAIEQTGLSRELVMTIFLADKLAQGKFCTDKDELMAIRSLILKIGHFTLDQIYEMQKAEYGNKE